MKFTHSPLLLLMLLCTGSVLLSQIAVWVAEQPSARARDVSGGRASLAPKAKRAKSHGPTTAPPELVVTAAADGGR
jgi:hypothetical protein